MTDVHEQTIQEFLEPLRSIEPVTRPAAHTARRQQRGMRVVEYAASCWAWSRWSVLIAFLSHHRSGSARPAGSGTVGGARPDTRRVRQAPGAGSRWAVRRCGRSTQSDPARRVVLWHHPGDPVEWSRDGTKLLIDGFNAGFVVVRLRRLRHAHRPEARTRPVVPSRATGRR